MTFAPYITPPLRSSLPDPPVNEGDDADLMDKVLAYLPNLNAAILQALVKKVPISSPVAELLLASPNGSVYAITVSDTGVLSTHLRYQQT
jgi:hypothetical protein